MSSLFHAFTLCQLWTVYLEQLSCTSAPTSEAHNITMGILFEFWGKVTPCILQLVASSKMVRHHSILSLPFRTTTNIHSYNCSSPKWSTYTSLACWWLSKKRGPLFWPNYCPCLVPSYPRTRPCRERYTSDCKAVAISHQPATNWKYIRPRRC